MKAWRHHVILILLFVELMFRRELRIQHIAVPLAYECDLRAAVVTVTRISRSRKNVAREQLNVIVRLTFKS